MSRTFRRTPESIEELLAEHEPLMHLDASGWLHPTGRTINPHDMSTAIGDALPALAEALAAFVAGDRQ